MVRGPAALLAAGALAVAYFAAAGLLPDLGTSDAAVLVAGAVGAGLIAAIVLALVACGEALVPLALLLVGSGLLVGALDAAGAGAGATAPEALLAGSCGVLLGRLLAAPAVAIAIPLFVAAVDVWSVAAGPSSRLADDEPRGAGELSFDLPFWGSATHGAAARLGLVDALFLAMFATWALRFGLRTRATALGMTAGLVAALAVSLASDTAIPALPFVALGYWLPNVDRLPRLLRSEAG